MEVFNDGTGDALYVAGWTLEEALKTLGYSAVEIESIKTKLLDTGYLDEKLLKNHSHKKVFQTAVGADPISPQAHLKMMAAVQPFVSGARFLKRSICLRVVRLKMC